VAFLVLERINMQPWTGSEKRKAQRFEIDIPIDSTVFQEDTAIRSKIHDISSYGLGTTVPRSLPVGTVLDVVLRLPEKDDQVSLRGRIIWSQNVTPDHYRVGVRFIADDFNPIPCVLKTLQHKAMARFPYGHVYPA
jgi:hypothetical protein